MDAIFLSHMHADHMGGFFMFMQSLWLAKRRKELPVYMPGSAIEPMKRLLEAAMIYEGLLQFQMQMLPLKEGSMNVVKSVRVTAFATSHVDGLRRKFPRSSAKHSACCFLLEHKKLRVGHTADLGKPEDLDRFSRGHWIYWCANWHTLRPKQYSSTSETSRSRG